MRASSQNAGVGRPLLLLLSLAMANPALRADAQPGTEPANPLGGVTLAVLAISVVLSLAAGILALRASRQAAVATQEAGAARARAAQGQGGISSDALGAAERVWNAKFTALEAQLQGGQRAGNGARSVERAGDSAASRLAELEKVVAGHSVTLQGIRQPGPTKESHDVVWPRALSGSSSAMEDVRAALAQAIKAHEPAAKELVEKLKAAEKWETEKPSARELSDALVDISATLLSALRRGGGVAPLDGALLSDRVLGALRPAWKSVIPSVDCRSFYPGSTFDPDWMEDHTRNGLKRPVISEMLSWAVFEKTDANRRLLAKARVTTD